MTRREAEVILLTLNAEPESRTVQPGVAWDAVELLRKLPDWAIHEYTCFSVARIDEERLIEFHWARSPFMFNPGQRFCRIRTAGEGAFEVAEGEDDPDAKDEPIRRFNLSDPDVDAKVARLLTWQTGGPPA